MIALVNMPFGSIMRAPLALSQIKSQLAAGGVAARVHNLNFAFARAIGFGRYEMIARFKGVETQVSEWLFAEAAWRRPFGPSPEEFLGLAGEELDTIPNVDDPAAWLARVRRDVVPVFLEHAYQRLIASGVPRVVGFSCMFFQTIAALALGRMLKERHPEIAVIYGGTCFHGEAGEELFAKLEWIDAVSTGEADAVIAPLFEALLAGETPRDLAGVRARDRDGVAAIGPAPELTPAAALDQLPDPDFTDFFADAAEVGLMGDTVWRDRVSLPFEASRGCWWGQKKHCTFCGLNGEGMAFRARDPDAVVAMLERLVDRYPARNLQATDNIMAVSYFRSFLPRLASRPLRSASGEKVDLFFEVKANLKREQIAALAAANVCYVQPGIENLSTHILDSIDKGVTALQNVYFLKCATEYGLLPVWNLLIRVPGERVEDYAQMERWIPLLAHLRPPTGGTPRVECHRYSPYFFRPGDYVEARRPARWYRGLYPDEIDLERVAYYFEARWRDTLGGDAYDRVIELTDAWKARWRDDEPPGLTARETSDGLEIADSRGDLERTWELEGQRATIYRCLGDITSVRRLTRTLEISERALRAELEGLIDCGLALAEGDRVLGLALPPTSATPLAVRKLQMRDRVNQNPRAQARLQQRSERLKIVRS